MNIYKNFLKKDDFNIIQSVIMSDSMPWFFADGVNKKNNKDFQFTFNFILPGGIINCSQDMLKILGKIELLQDLSKKKEPKDG